MFLGHESDDSEGYCWRSTQRYALKTSRNTWMNLLGYAFGCSLKNPGVAPFWIWSHGALPSHGWSSVHWPDTIPWRCVCRESLWLFSCWLGQNQRIRVYRGQVWLVKWKRLNRQEAEYHWHISLAHPAPASHVWAPAPLAPAPAALTPAPAHAPFLNL